MCDFAGSFCLRLLCILKSVLVFPVIFVVVLLRFWSGRLVFGLLVWFFLKLKRAPPIPHVDESPSPTSAENSPMMPRLNFNALASNIAEHFQNALPAKLNGLPPIKNPMPLQTEQDMSSSPSELYHDQVRLSHSYQVAPSVIFVAIQSKRAPSSFQR